MTRWVVKLEFVPLQGAAERSDDDLRGTAETVRSAFVTHEAAANGAGNRFVVSAKIDAESYKEAQSWARTVLFDFIDDALPDWRLERLDAWSA